MNRSIRGVHFALGIPLVLALAVSPASADEMRPKEGKQQQAPECVPKVHAKAKPKHRKIHAQAARKPQHRVRAVAQRKPSAGPKPPAHPSEACPPGTEKAKPAQPPPAQPSPAQPAPAQPPPEQPREIERKKEPAPQGMREPEQQPEQGYLPAQPAQPAQPQPPPMAREPAQQPEQGQPPEANCQYIGAPQATINERALCSLLAERAQLQYEEIPGGAAIVLTPRPGYALADLRRGIDNLEYALQVARRRDLPVPAVQERCYLFDLYRRTGDLPRVMEGANIMRLQFTTSKTGEVTPLRTEAYQFACTLPQ